MSADSEGDVSKPAPGVRQIVGSVFAAAFGVQNNKNRERDFKYGKAAYFIAAGILFTTLFVLAIVAVVKLVLRQAGM